MKNLKEFYESYSLNEMARPKGSKNKPKGKEEEAVDAINVDPDTLSGKSVLNGKVVPAEKVEDLPKGVDAEDNGSNGIIEIDRYTVDDLGDLMSFKGHPSANLRKLSNRFKSNADFMVIGERGWAKSQSIVKMAKMSGRHIVTVYLDKAEAADLGGIPVSRVGKRGDREAVWSQNALPPWAQVMFDEPKEKFLLFLDELNQAADDVLNAIMPIVEAKTICGIKFPNMIVGAAGNLTSENMNGLSDILSNKPLCARLFPFKWKTHTDEEWASHFEWAHKEYDSKIGPEIIDYAAKYKDMWSSPRDITKKIYKWCEENQNGTNLDVDDMVDELAGESDFGGDDEFKGCIWEDTDVSTSDQQKWLFDMASKLIDYADGKFGRGKEEKEETTDGGRKRGDGTKNPLSLIGRDAVEKLKKLLISGSVTSEYEKGVGNFFVTQENIIDVWDDENNPLNAEIIEKIVKQIEQEGKTVKYKTNKEAEEDAKKTKLLDPTKEY